MLDCARKPYRFELLDCLFDKPEEKEKYVRALTTLAKVSDVLKTPMPDFDDEDVKTITNFCEEWGYNWLEDLKKNNTQSTRLDICYSPIHQTSQKLLHVL